MPRNPMKSISNAFSFEKSFPDLNAIADGYHKKVVVSTDYVI